MRHQETEGTKINRSWHDLTDEELLANPKKLFEAFEGMVDNADELEEQVRALDQEVKRLKRKCNRLLSKMGR